MFTTPDGAPFYAGTYWPPVPVAGRPAFRDVLDAVAQAWEQRRDQAVETGDAIRAALRDAAAGRRTGVPRAAATAVDGSGTSAAADSGLVADPAEHARRVVDRLEAAEDRVHGGFGGAPKFPVAPTLELLLDVAASSVVDPEVARRALVLAGRTIDAMAASPLRDVDGGFFRYATRPDWSEPHYERMLYDNAQLLSAATTLAVLRRTGPVDGPLRTPAEAPGTPDPGEATAEVAGDVGRFLLRVLRLADGAFASAQDSESVVDGERVEGGYYLLPPGERAHHEPPPLDTKVLTGWNGLAVEALARAGHHLALPDLTDAARGRRPAARDARPGRRVARAGVGGRRRLGRRRDAGGPRRVRGGAPRARGLTGRRGTCARACASSTRPSARTATSRRRRARTRCSPSSGWPPARRRTRRRARCSGTTAAARAALLAHLATGEPRYRDAALAHVAASASASEHPIGAAGVLRVAVGLAEPPHQLVVVADADRREGFLAAARDWYHPGGLLLAATPGDAAALTADGVGLLADRGPGAYLCADFVCRLPVHDPRRCGTSSGRDVPGHRGAGHGPRSHDGRAVRHEEEP